jgi:integrase
MPYIRTCLYPPDWPERERIALEKSLTRGGLFDTSEAVGWSPDTLNRRIRSYGTFLFFARGRGELDDCATSTARASGRLLAEFIDDLKERVTLTTVAITLAGMAAILRIIDPGRDRTEVEAAARYYERIAEPSPDKHKIVSIGASELFHAGIARFRRCEKDATSNSIAAVTCEDGLMMIMLACKPIRLRNVHGSRVGVHIVKNSLGIYEWRFSRSETKNRERVQAELAPSATPFIDRWLQEIRPFLLGRNDHDAMWVTTRGNPMSRSTVYWRFCNATEQELGVRINPHAVRHIAGTSIAISMPDSVRMIPFVLDNDYRTAQKHYNLAEQLCASFHCLQKLERRRQLAFTRMKARP